MRFLPILLLAVIGLPAAAQPIVVQPPIGIPAAREVERIAPHLVPFAGSQQNFDSLVGALSLGIPATLETIGADGTRQLVTLTPGTAPMSVFEIVQTLELARRDLLASGIRQPSAGQLVVALTGAEVPVIVERGAPLVSRTVGDPVSPARELQLRVQPGASRSVTDPPFVPRGNTSDSLTLGNTSDTPQLAPNRALVGPGERRASETARGIAAPRALPAPAPSPRPSRPRPGFHR